MEVGRGRREEKRKTPPYALYQYKCENCVITAYESGKVVFQGEDADALAELIQPQPIVQKTDFMGFPQAGPVTTLDRWSYVPA